MSNAITLNYYNSNAAVFSETTKNVDFSEVQQIFTKHLSPDASILDFGCGSGRDTKYFLNNGYHVTATDGSGVICKMATDYTGIQVKQMLFEELDDRNQYDGIWACASVLHLSREKLPNIFHKMHQALKTNGLERAILQLTELSDLPANASKIEIKNAIREHQAGLKKTKEQLTNMVPYRALAGFFTRSNEVPDWGSVKRITAYIQKINELVTPLPYVLGDSSKLKKEVHFHPDWVAMIQDNTVNILGWIQYEKVKWLQNNNPEVPGLIYKLAPMDEKMRKLSNVRKLWQGIMKVQEIRDIFTGQPVKETQYDVDHFIPWSFVMNDELWNLMPMDSSLNSAKSNRLPKWNPFFEVFAGNQYLMYEMINERPDLHKRFEACYRDNLHSIWAGQELYRKGNSREVFYNILERNMMPVYDSARRQGYEIWNYG